MNKNKLLQLLKQEEGAKLDFKANLSLCTESEKKELAKDVISQANSRGGRGYIVYGVEDKTKKILGINPEDFQEERIQQIIYNRVDPPIPIAIDIIEIEKKSLAVLTIFKSIHKPHQMLQTGTFYIRRGSTTDVARRSEIASMFQESGMLTYETVLLKNCTLDFLNLEILKNYFRTLDVVADQPNEVLLEAMGIAGPGSDECCHPTIGGLLLFGKNPHMVLPHVFIRIECKSEIRYVYGNILEMLEKSMDIIRSFIGDTDYPYDAVEEVLANAQVHRDYLDMTKGISINITDKNIEISNPGALLSNNNVYRFMRENNPERRNPWLYQRLITFDPKKRFLNSGLGMQRVKKAFEPLGKVKYINLGSQNLFKVVLPLHKSK